MTMTGRIGESLLAGQDNRLDIVQRTLGAVRAHLGMEIAYLSEFVGDRSVFRAVDAPGLEDHVRVGDTHALRDIYCQHILEGRLPELIPDTSLQPVAMALPITRDAPIGSHVSIPIRRPDGTAFGMFCCLSSRPNTTLNERDLQTMRMFSDVVSREINEAIAERQATEARRVRVEAAFEAEGSRIVLQPIFDLGCAVPSGFEALCRFSGEPYRSPDIWFAEADRAGRLVELELHVMARALETLRHLPDDVYVSVNLSPDTVIRGDLLEAFRGHPFERIVLELTEHATVSDYDALIAALAPLRFDGMRVAVDDAGAGFSGLQHIVRLRPDMIKLDMTLTRDIDRDWPRRSLATALVHFAAQTRSVLVAEGIETAEELAALRELGVHRGQGYHLGRPDALGVAQAYFGAAGAGTPRVA